MYKVKTLIVFLLSGYINLLFSASIQDSLRVLLLNSEEDTAKVNLYNTLSLEVYLSEPDSAMLYTEKSISLAKKLEYSKGEAFGNFVKGKIFLEQSRYKDCIKYLNKALSIYENENDVEKLKGNTRMVLGRAYDYTGDYFNSLDQFQKSIEDFRQIEYAKGIANSNVNIGIIHYRLKDNFKALEYYRKAETKYLELKDSIGLVYIYNNIGFIDYENQKYSAAKANYLKGIQLSESIGFEQLLSFLYNNLGEVYNKLGETSEAEETFTKANEISVKLNDKEGIVNSLMALATINYKTKDYDKYIKDIIWCYDESKQQGNKVLIQESSELLSEMFDFKGDKAKAHQYLNEAYQMQDSLNSSSLIEETSGLEKQFQLEQKKKQEALEIDSKNKQFRYRSILFCSICSLLIGFIFLKNRENNAKDKLNSELMKKNALLIEAEQNLEVRNQELEKYIESNIQLEQFAHFASHDLKSPLRTIANFTGLLKKNVDVNDKKTDSYFQAIETGTKRMNALVNDLLDHAKLNSQVLTIEKFAIKDIVKEVEQNLDYAINQNDINLVIKDNNIEIEADRSKVKQVIENLISNATKFTSSIEEPLIEVSVKESELDYAISVSDNGIGIEEKYHDSIFSPFKQLHTKSKYEGTGLGLAICKNIIEKHGGQIWVESKEGNGTIMQFNIPKKS